MSDFDAFPITTGIITLVITVLLYKLFKAKQVNKDEEEEEEQQQQQPPQQSESKKPSTGPLKTLEDPNEKNISCL